MSRARLLLGIAAVALAAPVATASGQDPDTRGTRFAEALRSPSAAVSTTSPDASAAALEVLDEGGNAMDAAVTAVFAAGVARPESCGIGGGGFLVHRSASGEVDSLDFREQSPVEYRYSAGVTSGSARLPGTGNNAAGVPGAVAGLSAALKRHGSVSLARAVGPAERLAREGVTVTAEQAALWAAHQERLSLFEESRRVYLVDGAAPYETGDVLVQADLADALEAIAEDGPEAFYEGAVAKAVVAGMPGSRAVDGDRGTMGMDDLIGYRPFWRRPLQTSYRSTRIITVPPPASGGLAVVEALNLLERVRPFPSSPVGASRFHLLAEVRKLAWADGGAYAGDPRFTDIPLDRLTAMAYANERRPEVLSGRAQTYEPGAGRPEGASGPGEAGAREGANGVHVSVIDAQGNAAAITCTLGQPFGSAVVPEGTGVLLNDALAAFNAPGTGTAANAPAPAKRPRSSAAPVIVTRAGAPLLVAGATGGPAVAGGVLDTIVNALDYDLGLAAAVDAPRGDARGRCEGAGRQLCLEDARVTPGAIADLGGRGHAVSGLGEYAPAPEVSAVGIDPATDERLAAADPRGPSGAAAQTAAVKVLRVRTRPASPRTGRRVRVRFTARDGDGRAVRRALVRFAGATARTGRGGSVTITRRLSRPGVVRALVTKPGHTAAVLRIAVRRR